MLNTASHFRKQCPSASQILWLPFCLFFALYSFAIGGEKKSDAELSERKIFMESAMEEQWERTSEALEEMHKRGIYPYLIVTTLRPFGDWDFYFVYGGSIIWEPNEGQQFHPVEVPEGFVTDLTSIPRIFWLMLRPEGRYAYAAVVHDYLYWEQTGTREEADQILKIAMEDSKVDPKIIEAVYLAVRGFGQSAWDNNARMKKAGERRIINQFPDDFTISWDDWKMQPGVFADE